jgi:hypothetical protein
VDLDPLQNIGIIKTMHYWHNLSAPARDRLHGLQRRSVEPINELMDLYWSRAEPEVTRLIDEDKISLQHSRFDLNSDGLAEDPYRTNAITGGRVVQGDERDDPVSLEGPCANFGLHEGDQEYIYYTPLTPSSRSINEFQRTLRLSANGFFSYKGEVYLEYQRSIFKFKNDFPPSQICYVQINSKRR